MEDLIRTLGELQVDVEDGKNPFIITDELRDVFTDVYPGPECCRFCPNNPKNNSFSGGVCCCMLPCLEDPLCTAHGLTVTTSNNTIDKH